MRDRARQRWTEERVGTPRVVAAGTLLEPEALTIGFARRFAGYKRPELIFRGVPFLDGAADELLDELRNAVEASLARSAEEEIREISLLQENLHDDVARFVYDRLKRRPMVLPVVVEV